MVDAPPSKNMNHGSFFLEMDAEHMSTLPECLCCSERSFASLSRHEPTAEFAVIGIDKKTAAQLNALLSKSTQKII